jgi:aminoglycoside 6'-N-acetyltransferase
MKQSDFPQPPPEIAGKRVLLRRLSENDRPRLRSILAEQGVARWWAPRGAEAAVNDLYADEVVYAVEIEGVVAGAIEFHEEDSPDYRHAGIDIFLDEAHQGCGYGGDAIRAMARYLCTERGHHRLTIDPAVANERAIRAYERVGFRRVGVMRQYERGADGSWHDAQLLDMLRDELGEEI